MNKKTVNIIIGVMLLLFTHTIYGQNTGVVGINTNTPQTTLDVNGTVRVRNAIRLGGVEGTIGNVGRAGQVITSRGADTSPVWAAIDSPSLNLGYGITESITLSDSQGVIFAGTTGDSTPDRITELTAEYLEDSELSAANGWVEIAGLSTEITPTKANNRVAVTLQTVAQALTTGSTADVVFAMGIFVDGKLKSTRPVSVNGSGSIFTIGTLFDTFENLPPKLNEEPYSIQVAVSLRYRYIYTSAGNIESPGNNWTVFIGTSTGVDNTNLWMNTSSLKVELYEEIE